MTDREWEEMVKRVKFVNGTIISTPKEYDHGDTPRPVVPGMMWFMYPDVDGPAEGEDG